MKNFAKYCGIFGAGNLFVEVAIPTALLLSADKIRFSSDIKLKRGDLWVKEEKEEFEMKYNRSLSNLLENYPQDLFFVHPIKLSRWS